MSRRGEAKKLARVIKLNVFPSRKTKLENKISTKIRKERRNLDRESEIKGSTDWSGAEGGRRERGVEIEIRG